MTIIVVVIQTTTIIHLITIVVQVILIMIAVATILATTIAVLMIVVAVGQVVVIRQVMIQAVLMIVHLQVRLIGRGRPKMAYNEKVLQKAGINCTSAQLKLNLIKQQNQLHITFTPAFCNTVL